MNQTAETSRAVWCCSTCGAVYHKDFPRCPSDGAEVVMAARDPMLGASIGHYRIQNLIGEGGMGRVYLAEHATLPKRYAFKVLLGDHAASAVMRTRFTREAERASQLEHPNISQVVDFGQTERGLLYIVMDYVEGPSLVTLIGDAPMAPARVVALAREICRGLRYAHAAGIVHRDLKPENILVSRGPAGEEIPQLVDFGLAMSVDQRDARLTESGMTMGTPAFAAPEQMSGKPIDHRADLYALGMTMFEMLTGGVPPIDGSMMEVVAARTSRDAPRVSEQMPEIPPGLDEIVARLTRKRPADRYASAQDVIDALDAFAAGELAGPARAAVAATVAASVAASIDVAPPAVVDAPAKAHRPPTRLSTELVRPPRSSWLAGAIGGGALVALAAAFAFHGSPAAPAAALPPALHTAQVAQPPAAAAAIAPAPGGEHLVVAARIQPLPSPRTIELPRPRALYTQLSPVEVRGSLSPGEVQRAVDRQRAALARCATAATAPATVTAQFSIGEARRARAIHTAGPVGALNACVGDALTAVRTASAPDIGDVDVTVRIAFAVKQ